MRETNHKGCQNHQGLTDGLRNAWAVIKDDKAAAFINLLCCQRNWSCVNLRGSLGVQTAGGRCFTSCEAQQVATLNCYHEPLIPNILYCVMLFKRSIILMMLSQILGSSSSTRKHERTLNVTSLGNRCPLVLISYGVWRPDNINTEYWFDNDFESNQTPLWWNI